MIKISAAYCYANPNFVIQNLNNNHDIKPYGQASFCALLSNILVRGCPTIPSKYLRDTLGHYKSLQAPIKYVLSHEELSWDSIIKGSETKNPALDFYNIVLPQIFPSSIAATFIPELSVNEIIKSALNFGQVDFYSPLLNLVIEIDGRQHETGEQYSKDRQRDNLFERNNVSLVRIKTSEILNIDKLKPIFAKILRSRNISQLIKVISSKLSKHEIDYSYVVRIEQLLLNLYKTNTLKLTDQKVSFGFLNSKDLNEKIIRIAIENFYLWVYNLAQLKNISFNKPEIEVSLYNSIDELLNHNGYKIDISIYELYSVPRFDSVIHIRNDYFLFPMEGFNFPFKNYFNVEIAQTHYELDREKHKVVLQKILNDVSDIYTDFRPNQLEIIIECLNNRCVFGILPVGSGKSLCYQICSLLITQLTIVIAPLQLLMDDQYNNIVNNLGANNITVIRGGKTRNLEKFSDNQSLITIVSPERFFSESFRAAFTEENLSVGFIVIDEVHCLSEWGHDFRTSYLCLAHNLSMLLPQETYLMALTGTASLRVYEDIVNELFWFKKKDIPVVQADSMRRDNLKISVEQVDNIYDQTIETILPTLYGVKNDKILVFTKKRTAGRRQSTEDLDSACIPLVTTIKQKHANKIACKIEFYAGGDALDDAQKTSLLNEFKSGDVKIVFSTKAFGMGVDIPDIRKTIHYGLPSSLESLYQQIGRAGRDNNTSHCYVFFKKEKNETLLNELFSQNVSVSQIAQKFSNLNELQTNFYFIQNANIDPEIELQVTKRIRLGVLKRNQTYGKQEATIEMIKNALISDIENNHLVNLLDSGSSRTIIERALYRLFLLGEIEMWSLSYGEKLSNPVIRNLKLTDKSEEEKFELLKNRMTQYDSTFRFTYENTFENRAKVLINWSFKNFLGERIQSMKTLYEWCVDFTDSHVFMGLLNAYFMNDPAIVRLVQDKDSRDINPWLNILYLPPQTIKLRIARLLESYGAITSLNFISGIARLILDDFEDADGEDRLNLAMIDIAEWAIDERQRLFEQTYKYISDNIRINYKKEHIDLFVKTWLSQINIDVKWIYLQTKNPLSAKMLVINDINRLLKIGEKIYDKL